MAELVEALVILDNISKEYGSRGKSVRVIDNISLEIGSEFLAILGPSGCGKSTLLRMIAGVEKPSSGRIVYKTHDKGSPSVGFVFQSPTLYHGLQLLRTSHYPSRPEGSRLKRLRRLREDTSP